MNTVFPKNEKPATSHTHMISAPLGLARMRISSITDAAALTAAFMLAAPRPPKAMKSVIKRPLAIRMRHRPGASSFRGEAMNPNTASAPAMIRHTR